VLGCRAKAAVLVAAFLVLAVEGYCSSATATTTTASEQTTAGGERRRGSWPTESPSAPGYSRGGPPVPIRMVRLARGTHAVKRPCAEPEVRYGPRSQEIAGALPPTSGPAADPLGVARGHGPTQRGIICRDGRSSCGPTRRLWPSCGSSLGDRSRHGRSAATADQLCGLGAVLYPEHLVGGAQVLLDGGLREEQPTGYLGVAQPFDH